MGLATTLSIIYGAYIAAVGFALVYVFRYFNMLTEMHPHYVGAFVAFIGLALHTGEIWPLIGGLITFVTFKLLKDKNYIFWAEIAMAIPYLTYLIL